MASGYPGRDLRGAFGIGPGSAIPIQVPYHQRSDGGAAAAGGGALMKRSLTELERQQQQQIQHALYWRSVKQRTLLASPISSLSAAEISAFATPASSTSSSYNSDFGYLRPGPVLNPSIGDLSFPPPDTAGEPDSDRKSTIRNRLQELERQLLDDDEVEDEGSASESAITAAEWGETMQQLISPPPPAQNPLSSPSPTTSSSSTSSSSASCSPGSGTTSRQMLLDTATAMAEGNMETAVANLAVLKRAANPRGDPEQRLTAMMVAALVSRINPPAPGSGHPIAELCSAEHQSATQLLYNLSPCFKLGLFAANLAILDATMDAPKIHVLDFDVGQGSQHAALITALADRHRRTGGTSRPPPVEITAICDPTSPFNCFNVDTASNLRIVGDRLASLAERIGVGLRFSIVTRRVADLDEAALGCEAGEALAVNLAFHLSRVADESVSPANPRDELLRRVKALSPRVVVLVEQEVNGNTAPFAARFAEACGHYGAVLESLDATAPRESGERARVEALLARKAGNSVAREAAERVERCEVFGKWRARMGMAGLRAVPLGPAVADPVRARLASLRTNPGFVVKEDAGGLCFGWMGRVLTVASAWR